MVNIQVLLILFKPVVSTQANNNLLALDKASGPDGMNFVFFQKF